VFSSALDAISCAADIQRNLANVAWATSPGLVVRASLHTGTAEQMGMARDMLNTMTKIARVRAATGHDLDAAEMLASIWRARSAISGLG
jgi:hypothetical protein